MKKLPTQIKSDPWIDHNGEAIPKGRVYSIEKKAERFIGMIANKALIIEDKLAELKKLLDEKFEILMKEDADHHGYDYDPTKSHTAYLFNRTVKIERKVNKSIYYNESKLEEAKNKFQEFIDGENPPESIRKIIKDTFQNTRGNFDKNKANRLLSYKTESSQFNPKFLEALEVLEQSRAVGDAKVYYTIYHGKYPDYVTINLNLSII